MFDINRLVVLVLIMALLYALYFYQNKLPFLSESSTPEEQKKAIEQAEPVAKSSPDKQPAPKQTKPSKKKSKNDKADLISIDNMSQVSLGSLLDLDVNTNDGRKGYKKARELNSNESIGTYDSLLQADDESVHQNFFFRE